MQWQPIETAPKDGTRLLAYWPPVFGGDNAGCATTWWVVTSSGLFGWESPWEYADREPTHWMPLPEPPRAK